MSPSIKGCLHTLKYLEIKIEEWPSRAKLGQAGPSGAKWCQTESNGTRRGQKGQTRPNGADFFAYTHIFMKLKNHVLQPSSSDKNWPNYGDFVDSNILIGLH